MATLPEASQSFVLNQAGLYLRALGRLAEATQPASAGLEAYIAQEDWKNAATAAGNLSELYLSMGDLTAAVKSAQQSVELADRSWDLFEQLKQRGKLANALFQAGRLDDAEQRFREAEVMQEEDQPEFPLLYSLGGYFYCDLLLSKGGGLEAVLARAWQTFEWSTQQRFLLDIAFDHLSLGRAYLLMAAEAGDRGDFSQAAHHLDRAVDGLRQAGRQDHLPHGLLARAALHRLTSAFERAQRDLDETRLIAEQGGMRLHLADYLLESARLAAAQGQAAEARQHLATAKAMVEEMGYHRRDGEVEELEERLKAEG